MADASDFPDDVSPTYLSEPFMIRAIGRISIRAENSVEYFAESFFENFGASRRRYLEQRLCRRGECPQPGRLTHSPQSRFIHVDEALSGQCFFDFFVRRLKRFGDFQMEVTYRAQRDINPEDGFENIYNTTANHAAHADSITFHVTCCRPIVGAGSGRAILSSDVYLPMSNGLESFCFLT
jgi:hypothetical protein